MNNPEIYNVVGCAMLSALTHSDPRPLPRFIVWKKIGNRSVEVGRFRYRSLAETYANCQRELYKSMRVQITNVGEYPIWN